MSRGSEGTEKNNQNVWVRRKKSKHCRACVAFLGFVSFVETHGRDPRWGVEGVGGCHFNFTDGKTKA